MPAREPRRGSSTIPRITALRARRPLPARPIQAALASAATFAVGAGVPVVTILIAPATALVLAVSVVSLCCLVVLGAVAARIGGASIWVGAARVTFWGVLAMMATAAVGKLFGTTVG